MFDLDGPSPLICTVKILSFIAKDNAWAYILLIGLLIIGAFFSGSETAFSCCNKHRMIVLADDGKKSAKNVLYITDKFDSTIITILIGTNITHISMSVISTLIAIELFGNYGSLISTIIITLIVFFFGEMIPKSIAKYNSDNFARFASFPIRVLMIILFPLSKFFELIIFLFRKLISSKDDSEDETAFTEDDFQDVIEQIEEEGVIDEDESDILQAAVEFGDIKVRDVLTKRNDILALDIKQCNKKYLNQFLTNCDYSRIPIYEGSIDNIIGILHVRTYLRAYFKNKKVDIRSTLLKPYLVSPQITLDEIFEGYKANNTHIAIVKSKNGKTIGMVTMKDILEELVGDIDESDDASLKEGGEKDD